MRFGACTSAKNDRGRSSPFACRYHATYSLAGRRAAGDGQLLGVVAHSRSRASSAGRASMTARMNAEPYPVGGRYRCGLGLAPRPASQPARAEASQANSHAGHERDAHARVLPAVGELAGQAGHRPPPDQSPSAPTTIAL